MLISIENILSCWMNDGFSPSRYVLFLVALVSPMVAMDSVCFLGPGKESGAE